MPQMGTKRTMGGKRFTQVARGRNKTDANNKAENLRKRGFLARVTDESGTWYVWRGPRK